MLEAKIPYLWKEPEVTAHVNLLLVAVRLFSLLLQRYFGVFSAQRSKPWMQADAATCLQAPCRSLVPSEPRSWYGQETVIFKVHDAT